MSSECEGCIEYRIDNCDTDISPHLSDTEHCPCLNCLVKGICEKTCEDYIKYTDLCIQRGVSDE